MTIFNTWIESDGCGTMPLSLLTEMELLPISATNSLPNLTFIPAGGLMQIIVNGQTFTAQDGSFSVNGQVISWLSPIYSVNPGDVVVAIYSFEG